MSKVIKVLIITVVVLAFSAPPVFSKSIQGVSGGGKSTTYSLDLSWIMNAVNLIVGVFAGSYVLLKAAMDIFHAVRNSSEDPNGLKKAIGGLVLNIAILAGFLFVINYVFSGMAKDNLDISTATAQEAFFSALTGALVSFGL